MKQTIKTADNKKKNSIEENIKSGARWERESENEMERWTTTKKGWKKMKREEREREREREGGETKRRAKEPTPARWISSLPSPLDCIASLIACHHFFLFGRRKLRFPQRSPHFLSFSFPFEFYLFFWFLFAPRAGGLYLLSVFLFFFIGKNRSNSIRFRFDSSAAPNFRCFFF